jgi:hypothetical protein
LSWGGFLFAIGVPYDLLESFTGPGWHAKFRREAKDLAEVQLAPAAAQAGLSPDQTDQLIRAAALQASTFYDGRIELPPLKEVAKQMVAEGTWREDDVNDG